MKSPEQRALGRKALNRMQDCDYKCQWCFIQYEKHLCDGLAAYHQLPDGKTVHNMTDIIPLLIRGIKRCSRLWCRQYFHFPLKRYSEWFFFSEIHGLCSAEGLQPLQKSSTLSCRQSRGLLECIEENFLSPVIDSSTRGDAILGLLVTNTSELWWQSGLQ